MRTGASRLVPIAILCAGLAGGAAPAAAQLPPLPLPTPTPAPTPQPTPAPSPTPAPTPPAVTFRAPKGFVGLVAEDTFGVTGADRASQLSFQAGLGVTLLRQTFDWAEIERQRGVYTFDYYDAYVLDAARKGIRIMPILFRPPAFHSSQPATGARRGTYPPNSNAAFGRFARALAARYGSRGSLWSTDPSLRRFHIREWQVWNEPNLPVYWPRKPSAKRYAKMVVAVGKNLKRGDRSARVVLAGIPESKIGGAVPFKRYVRDVFRAGGARSFDTFAVHPYAPTSKGLFKRVREVRRFLDTLPGGKRKRLRVTEVGWASQGPKSRYTVGPTRQARYAEEMVRGLYRSRRSLKLDGFVFYNWRDATPFPGGKDFWGLHAGLMRLDGTPKPVLARFRRATQRLGR